MHWYRMLVLLMGLSLGLFACAGAGPPAKVELPPPEPVKLTKPPPAEHFYVRRWSLRLKALPSYSSKTVARLKLNDQVTKVADSPKGWVKISVDSTQQQGWVPKRDLSTKKVTRTYRRKRAAPSKEGEAEEDVEAEETPATSGLGPSEAEAAPPPAKKVPTRRKAKPEFFDPF